LLNRISFCRIAATAAFLLGVLRSHVAESAPKPPSLGKKGLQVQMIDDALALGIKHAALNVSITSLIDLDVKPDSFRWTTSGRTFAFHRGAVEGIPVKPLSDAGVRVYLILLCTATSDGR